jgi:hypothetical protein
MLAATREAVLIYFYIKLGYNCWNYNSIKSKLYIHVKVEYTSSLIIPISSGELFDEFCTARTYVCRR